MAHYNVAIDVLESSGKRFSCSKIMEATTKGDAIRKLLRECRWENLRIEKCTTSLIVNFKPSYDPFKQVKGPER